MSAVKLTNLHGIDHAVSHRCLWHMEICFDTLNNNDCPLHSLLLCPRSISGTGSGLCVLNTQTRHLGGENHVRLMTQ